MAVEGILPGKNIIDQTVTKRKLSFDIITDLDRVPDVIDNLTSQDRENALSANQGYVLDQIKANKQDVYTRDEIVDFLAEKVDKIPGKGLSTNDFTNELYIKLNGIEQGAEVNQNAYSSVTVNGTVLSALSKTDNFNIVNGSNISITANDVSKTITVSGAYPNATQSVSGLMSAADKTKLDSIQSGGEVNQNAFSNVVVGSTTISATSKTDTITLAGAGYASISGSGKIATISVSVPAATTTVAGLLSAADKVKLNGIATGAEVNQNTFSTISTTSGTASANSKTATLTVTGTGATTVSASGTTLTINSVNTTYGVATTTANGLMSAADKTKLNGITAGAQPNQNAFSNITVGGTTISASSPADTFAIASSNGIRQSVSGKTINLSGDLYTYIDVPLDRVRPSETGTNPRTNSWYVDTTGYGVTENNFIIDFVNIVVLNLSTVRINASTTNSFYIHVNYDANPYPMHADSLKYSLPAISIPYPWSEEWPVFIKYSVGYVPSQNAIQINGNALYAGTQGVISFDKIGYPITSGSFSRIVLRIRKFNYT